MHSCVAKNLQNVIFISDRNLKWPLNRTNGLSFLFNGYQPHRSTHVYIYPVVKSTM